MKRIVCHSKRDEKRVLDEINMHEKLANHPNVIQCEGYCSAKITSHHAIVYQSEQNHVVDSIEYNILLPYYRVKKREKCCASKMCVKNFNRLIFLARYFIGRIDVS